MGGEGGGSFGDGGCEYEPFAGVGVREGDDGAPDGVSDVDEHLDLGEAEEVVRGGVEEGEEVAPFGPVAAPAWREVGVGGPVSFGV